MKRLRVTLNGISYDVEVEVLEDDGTDNVVPSPSTVGAAPTVARPVAAAAPAPVPAPVATPAPAPIAGGSAVLASPIAGIIRDIKAAVGATVQQNEPVIIIEAMKMNTKVNAPVSGRVKEIHVKSGEAVKQGQALMVFE